MTTDDNHIDNLIAKYLAGETSQDEEFQLRLWMDASPENKKYFGDIRFVHDKTVASHPYIKVDAGKAWEKIKGQVVGLPSEAGTVNNKQSIWQSYWVRIAAAILLVIGSGAVLYLLTTTHPEQQEVLVTLTSKDSVVNRTFAGNTQVSLNRNSKITFLHKKSEKKKEFTLTGEAFIQVVHATDTQLIVKAEGTLIRDIGTSFNVKANPGSPTIEVFVESGEVAFYTEQLPGIVLGEGETGIFYKATKTFRKVKTTNPNIVSYKTRKFVFINTRLAHAIEELNSVYSEPIILESPNLANCTISVTFENEDLGHIIDIMSETFGFQVIRAEKGYVLSGERCAGN